MGFDEFLATIKNDAKSEADEIVSSAKMEAKRIVAQKKKELEKDYRRKLNALKSEMSSLKRKMFSKAELKVKTEFSKWLSSEVDRILDESWNEIKNFKRRNPDEYKKFLVSMVVESAKIMDENRVNLVLAESDKGLKDEIISGVEKEGVKVEGVEFEDFAGGVKVVSLDGRVVVDESLETRFERMKSELGRIVLRTVAEAENGSE